MPRCLVRPFYENAADRGERENGFSMTESAPHTGLYPGSGDADLATLGRALEGGQASGDQFRVAIDRIPGLVWSALPDGNIDFLNQRWLEYTGLTLEQASGWGWQAAVC